MPDPVSEGVCLLLRSLYQLGHDVVIMLGVTMGEGPQLIP
ncbi:hypothetical protein J2X43_005964 [Rhizobium sp. BE258]|nr:hypothetical protein [Rhizobium sp. BE258]